MFIKLDVNVMYDVLVILRVKWFYNNSSRSFFIVIIKYSVCPSLSLSDNTIIDYVSH